MGSLPALKARQVIALLEAHGFEVVRQRGPHKQLRHPDGRSTTVPFHKLAFRPLLPDENE